MIILLGESGAGKTTLQNYLCEHHGYKKAISHTTRPKRNGEIDGKDYYFVDTDEFTRMYHNGEFAETSRYRGWEYGLAVNEIKENTIAVLTPSGLRQINRLQEGLGNISTIPSITSFYLYVDRNHRLAKLALTRNDLEECIRRNQTDVGIFDGVRYEVDCVLTNCKYLLSVEELARTVKGYLRNNA